MDGYTSLSRPDKIMTLVFFRKGEMILLAQKKRGFGKDKWNGVGGKIEPSESTEQALIRECQEEINITPINFDKRAELLFNEYFDGKLVNFLVFVYFCSKWQGEPIETDEMMPKWFKVSELPYDNMWQDDKYWLPKVIKGKKIKAVFNMDGQDNVIDHKIEIIKNF